MYKRIFVVISVMLLMSGCSKKIYVPVDSVRVDTFVKSAVRVDSVRLTDSVYVIERTLGDTVYIVKTKTQWRDRVQLRIDTVYRSKTDTITKVVEVQAKRQRVRWWPYLLFCAFFFLGGIFVAKKL